MKIDLGNFGYQPREAVSAQVDRGDPTVMAKAMQNVAEAQLQQRTRANEAWAQAGKSLQQLGQNAFEIIDEKAKLGAANNIQKAQSDFADELQRLTISAQKGEIKSEDILPAYQKFKDSYQLPDVDGLGPMSTQRYKDAFKQTGDQFGTKFEGLRADTHRAETKIALDTNSDQAINNGIKLGQTPEQTLAYGDQPGYDAMVREAYGPEAGRYKHAWQQKVLTTYAGYGISQTADNANGLMQMRAQLNDPNSVYSRLDADSRLQLNNTIGHHLDHLSALAAQQRAHADAVAAQNERNAETLYNSLERRIRDGQIIPQQELAQANQFMAGTQFGRLSGGVTALQHYEVAVQQFKLLPPSQQEAQLRTMNNRLNTVGGSDAEYKTRDALQGFMAQREKQANENPVALGYADINQQPPALNFEYKNTDDLHALGAALTQNMDMLKVQQAKLGPMVSMAPIPPQDMQNLQAKWDKMTPDQQTKFATDVRSVVSPETYQAIMNQMKGVTPERATVMEIAHTPQGFSIAKDMRTGEEMMKKGAISPPKDTDLAGYVDRAFPSGLDPKGRQQAVQVIKPVLIARGFNADNLTEDVVTDVLHQTIGERVAIAGNGLFGEGSNTVYAIAPAGVSADRFKNEINDGLNALPGDTGKMILNGLESGSYQLVRDREGNYRVSDGKRYVSLGTPTNSLRVTK